MDDHENKDVASAHEHKIEEAEEVISDMLQVIAGDSEVKIDEANDISGDIPTPRFGSSSSSTEDDEDPQDVLLDLYLYIKQKRRMANDREVQDYMIFGDVVFALKGEGILFWRDKRYEKSQRWALEWFEKHEQLQKGGAAAATTGVSIEETRERVESLPLHLDVFVSLVKPCARLFLNAFNEENVIPDWTRFVSDLEIFYSQSLKDESGANADYIPILKSANPNRWGVSICSISGQRYSMGDATIPFSLQSVSKPVTYAIGMSREGEEFMEEWISVEPAGRPFNTQDLDPESQRPFNASVNSGAIMAAGILASRTNEETGWKKIVDEIRGYWERLCGNDAEIGFSDETFESEKDTAYNNFAIAYNIKGRRGLPRNVDLHKMLDVYLGCCSIEMTAEALSVAAATLSNGGICPITGEKIFPTSVVRSVLAETMACGMYDGAGRFMVEVGLPAKSGVSGALMVIVPGLFGLATFSPRLNPKGNSERGIHFCRQLVRCYRLHMFEPADCGKIDPRQNGWKDEQKEISDLAWATGVGDDEAARLGNIFLYALCRIAEASRDGFTSEKQQIIIEKYKTTFAAELDLNHFEEIVNDVKTNPEQLKFSDGYTHVGPAMKEIIYNAMLDIFMTDDGPIDDNKRRVTVRIAELNLGINKEVATLEIERHEKHVGHRFDLVEADDAVDEHTRESIFDSMTCTANLGYEEKARQHRRPSTESIFDSMTSTANLSLYEEKALNQESREEAVLLRKKIQRLEKKLAALVHVSEGPHSPNERRKSQPGLHAKSMKTILHPPKKLHHPAFNPQRRCCPW